MRYLFIIKIAQAHKKLNFTNYMKSYTLPTNSNKHFTKYAINCLRASFRICNLCILISSVIANVTVTTNNTTTTTITQLLIWVIIVTIVKAII